MGLALAFPLFSWFRAGFRVHRIQSIKFARPANSVQSAATGRYMVVVGKHLTCLLAVWWLKSKHLTAKRKTCVAPSKVCSSLCQSQETWGL